MDEDCKVGKASVEASDSSSSEITLSDDERINQVIDESITWGQATLKGMMAMVGKGDDSDGSKQTGKKNRKKKRTIDTANTEGEKSGLKSFAHVSHPDHSLESFPTDVRECLRALPSPARAAGIQEYTDSQLRRLSFQNRKTVIVAEPQERARLLMGFIHELEEEERERQIEEMEGTV